MRRSARVRRFLAPSLVGLAASFVAVPAFARSFRVSDVPNGDKYGCLTCHDDNQGGTFNNFGSAVLSHLEPGGLVQEAHADWAAVCGSDPDQDGETSGEELGDPGCTWSRGNGSPGGSISNPGHGDADAVCGNGTLDLGEDCEGTELTETSCLSLGAGVGDLACTDVCTYDYSDCSLPPGGAKPSEYTGDGCAVVTPGAQRGSGLAGFAGLAGLALALFSAAKRARR